MLDEHIGGAGEGSRKRDAAVEWRKCCDIARTGLAQRNGRGQKSPDGRPRGRIKIRLATKRLPVFPDFFNGQTAKAGRGEDGARPYSPPCGWGRRERREGRKNLHRLGKGGYWRLR